MFGSPSDLLELDSARFAGVEDLAIDSSSGALLHFGEVKLEEVKGQK